MGEIVLGTVEPDCTGLPPLLYTAEITRFMRASRYQITPATTDPAVNKTGTNPRSQTSGNVKPVWLLGG